MTREQYETLFKLDYATGRTVDGSLVMVLEVGGHRMQFWMPVHQARAFVKDVQETIELIESGKDPALDEDGAPTIDPKKLS